MSEASTQAPPRYNVLGELRDGPARRAFRARDAETAAELALHSWPRDGVPRAVLLSLQSSLPAYAAIDHPRLLRTRSLRADAENVVLETDMVAGESLERALVREPQLSPARALAIAEDVLDALVVLHTAGLTHGAVRPSTVWLDRDGRARLLAAGAGPIISAQPGDDFFCVFERLVPSGPERRAARDVFAAAALLYSMIEGKPPLSSPDLAARIRRERWPEPIGQHLARIVASVSPWTDDESRPDAATLLAMVRRAREEADRAIEKPKGPPSLLDDAAVPSLMKPSLREQARLRANAALRRLVEFATGSAWPTLAAAGLAAAIAALLAPFLGGDGWWTGVERAAQPMPPGNALSMPTNDPAARIDAPAAAPPRVLKTAATPWERTREEAQALTEIGDFQAALGLLSTAEAPEGELSEERNAVVARASTRLRELREITRVLAEQGRLEEARKVWDDAIDFWPNGDLRVAARVERDSLKEIADAATVKKRIDAENKTHRELEGELARAAAGAFTRDEGRHEDRVRIFAAIFQKAIDANCLPVRDDAEAAKIVLDAEAALVSAAATALQKRQRRVRIENVSKRFGSGDVADVRDGALVIARTGDKRDELPLSRLTGRERLSFFTTFQLPGNGAHSLALAALSLRAGLGEDAKAALWEAEATQGLDRPVRLLRRTMEEALK